MAGDSQQPCGHSLLKILSRLPSKSRAHWLRAQVATVTARPMAAPPPSPLLPGRSLLPALPSRSLLRARSCTYSSRPLLRACPCAVSASRTGCSPPGALPRVAPPVCCCTPLGAFRSFISAES